MRLYFLIIRDGVREVVYYRVEDQRGAFDLEERRKKKKICSYVTYFPGQVGLRFLREFLLKLEAGIK